MSYDYGGPSHGSLALVFVLLGAPLLWLAPRTAEAWAGLVALFGLVFVGAGIVQLALWLSYHVLDVAERRREMLATTPHNRALELAGRLNDTQAALVPALEFHTIEIDVLDLSGKVAFFLATPQARVPFLWLSGFLETCGVVNMREIRSYSEGTAGYEYARAFTDWCVQSGYALPATGNKAAQWVSEYVRDELKRRFGFADADLPGDIMTLTSTEG